MSANVIQGSGSSLILPNATGGNFFTQAETGLWVKLPAALCTLEALLSGTGALFALIEFHGSNFNSVPPHEGTRLCTLSLSDAKLSDSYSKAWAAYMYKAAKVLTLTGTSAQIVPIVGF